jgi:hypothetical protein
MSGVISCFWQRVIMFKQMLALGLFLAWGMVARATFLDSTVGFKLEAPNRFIQFPIPVGSSKVLAAFATSDPAAGVPDAAVGITRPGCLIGREHLQVSKLPANIPVHEAKVYTTRWKTFKVDVIAGRQKVEKATLAVRMAQIPLKPEAIQVVVAVPVEQEAKADGILQEFLANLDGPSNWLTDEDRSERLGYIVGMVIMLAAVGGYFLMRRKRMKTLKV